MYKRSIEKLDLYLKMGFFPPYNRFSVPIPNFILEIENRIKSDKFLNIMNRSRNCLTISSSGIVRVQPVHVRFEGTS